MRKSKSKLFFIHSASADFVIEHTLKQNIYLGKNLWILEMMETI